MKFQVLLSAGSTSNQLVRNALGKQLMQLGAVDLLSMCPLRLRSPVVYLLVVFYCVWIPAQIQADDN